MNVFSAFRSAAVAVSRPRRPHLLAVSQLPPAAASFHTTPTNLKKKEGLDPSSVQRKKIEIPEHKPIPKPRRGKKINIPFVHLLGPKDVPGPLRPLQEILDSVNEEEYYVELVSENPPTVRLVDIKESRVSTLLERQRKKPGAGSKNLHKEAQMTWSMAEADENHKLEKIRDDLEKGFRVDVVYSTKKGSRPPPRIEMQIKMSDILKKLDDVGKEWKPLSIDNKMGVLYLQSRKTKVTARAPISELKESIPKSVLEKKERLEKLKKHEEEQ